MGLELVGVEAVVEGLSSFRSGVGQLNSILDTLRPPATLIQKAFSSLGEGLIGFANKVWDVFSVTLGVLIRDAINAFVDAIKEMISQTIEAGSQFQILELRLQRLNFNDLRDSTLDYNQAQAEAIRLTQEQLDWILKLAAQTPYDAEDVANTFTLARAYGFTGDESQKLTQDILDFASGMGLTNQQMERVIVNFGQLQSQGKLNMMELRDLARGAFVPINDVLERMKRNMGLTNEEFNKMRLAGELTGPAIQEFFKAFHEMVGENFAGAAQSMASAFSFAVANLEDLVKGIGGLKIVKPILAEIGTFISDFVNQFTQNPERWDRLVGAADRIGKALSGIVKDIFGLIPSTEGLADGIVSGLENLATWLEAHRGDIVGFFEKIRDIVKNDVIPFIQDKLIPAIQGFGAWVTEHKDEIIGFFQSIGATVRDDVIPFLVDKLLPAIQEIFKPQGKEGTDSPILSFFTTLGKLFDSSASALPAFLPMFSGFVGVIIQLLDWVGKNPETVETILKIVLALEVLATIGSVLFGVVVGLLGVLPALIGLLLGLEVVYSAVVAAGIVWFVTKLDEGWETVRKNVVNAWENIKVAIVMAWVNIKLAVMKGIDLLIPKVSTAWDRIKITVSNIDWTALGASIISGMVSGITSSFGGLISATVNAVTAAYEAAKKFLQSNSPSKLYGELGKDQVEGMAKGILGSADLASKAMASVVPVYQMKEISAAMVSAARPSTSSTSTSTKNYNLTINTGAKSEPIIQDFNMMRSLAMG